ncbi:MAG: hypothetical protein HQK49_18785 [Oligoflexia bacterium]|nr:hypothetical protein [Oligoflexia bacterium]
MMRWCFLLCLLIGIYPMILLAETSDACVGIRAAILAHGGNTINSNLIAKEEFKRNKGEETVIIIINKKYFSLIRDRISPAITSRVPIRYLSMDNLESIKLSSIKSLIFKDLTVFDLNQVCVYTDVSVDYRCYSITDVDNYVSLKFADITEMVNIENNLPLDLGQVIGVITTKKACLR